MSVCCPPLSFIAFANGAGGTSANDTPLFFVFGNGLLSAVFVYHLFLVAGRGPLSLVLCCFLSFIASDSFLSVVCGCYLSFVANDGPLFAVSGCLLSPITSGGLLFAVFGGDFLLSIPPAGSQVLFLTSTPSRTRHFSLFFLLVFYSFLTSLLTPLACNLAALTRKRLFDQVLITQRPIASIQ